MGKALVAYFSRPGQNYVGGSIRELSVGNTEVLARGIADSLDAYETIILGFPNWWGTSPMPVRTFLDAFDLAGKTIAPLCANEASGMGSSEKDLATACPALRMAPGLAVAGHEASGCVDEAVEWARKYV